MGRLEDLFGIEKPVIGIINLVGSCMEEKMERALEEIEIYRSEGVSGVIFKSCNGDSFYAGKVMDKVSAEGNILTGVNFPTTRTLSSISSNRHGGKFVQVGAVQKGLPLSISQTFNQFIFGNFYFRPQAHDYCLNSALENSSLRCDAIVATERKISVDRIQEYKDIVGDFPVIIGKRAFDENNTSEQLGVADGAIIGKHFRPDYNMASMVDRYKVREVMDAVCKIRK